MKKKLLIILTLLTGLNCFSQDEFKKLEKGVCKIDHKCFTKYHYDDFDDVWAYSNGFYETALAKNGLLYIITKNVYKKSDKTIIYLTFIGNASGCRSKDSYIHIQFKNGEKLKIPNFSSEVECGTTFLTIDATEYMDLLMTEPIDKIRIYLDGTDDFIVTEKGQSKFFNNLKCIKDIDLS